MTCIIPTKNTQLNLKVRVTYITVCIPTCWVGTTSSLLIVKVADLDCVWPWTWPAADHLLGSSLLCHRGRAVGQSIGCIWALVDRVCVNHTVVASLNVPCSPCNCLIIQGRINDPSLEGATVSCTTPEGGVILDPGIRIVVPAGSYDWPLVGEPSQETWRLALLPALHRTLPTSQNP